MERGTWQIYCFGKRNILRLDLKESRKVFCQRGRGRSFHVDGLKTEKSTGINSGKSLSLLRDQLTIQGINHHEHESFFRVNKQDEISFADLPAHTFFAYSVRSFKPEYASTQTCNLIRQQQFLINSFFGGVKSRARQSVDSLIQVLL